MVKQFAPGYLSSLVPQSVSQTSGYNLRNNNNIQQISTRTALYANSFLPSVINDWNALPDEAKALETVNMFKKILNRHKPKPSIIFYFGDRRTQILHTRIRTNCSSCCMYRTATQISTLLACYIIVTTDIWEKNCIRCKIFLSNPMLVFIVLFCVCMLFFWIKICLH